MIDEILDEFDFEKVHRVMQALNWKWHGSPDVPSIADLRRTARSLLKQVVEVPNLSRTATGGFVAYMECGVLGLRFEVASFEKGIGQ